jgi:dolichol-phosphate mannosyltransferase
MRTWVTIPTYQEVENIDLVLRRVRDAVPDAAVLVVDDESPDGTADKAVAVASELGGIRVLRRPRKLGVGSAYRAGFAAGLALGYDVVAGIDADLSYDPGDIPRLLQAVEQGADLAIGSRYAPGGSAPYGHPMHSFASRVANRYAAWALDVDVRDATSGLRAYRASILRSIAFTDSSAEGYVFPIELTDRVQQAGGIIVEVPISFRARVRGRSKSSAPAVIAAAATVTRRAVRDRLPRSAPRS